MASKGDIIIDYNDILLRKSDLALLDHGKWISDNIISFWFEYLANEPYSEYKDSLGFIHPPVSQIIKSVAELPSFSSDLKAIIESLNIYSKKMILIAVSDSPTSVACTSGTHWSLLTYISSTGSFEHYDSFKGSVNHYHAKQIFKILSPLLTPNRESDIDLDFTECDCTQQFNGYDCGIHLMLNAEALCHKIFKNDERELTSIVTASRLKQARKEIAQLILKKSANL